MYDIEKIYQAKSIPDAIDALLADPKAIIISGGSDVLIKIREGKLAGCSLVSIHGIKELEGIYLEQDGTIVIKPGTSFSHVTYNEIIQKYIPILGNAVDQVGGPQIRNIGTIGGNICNGVTSADSASTLFALNAVVEITGKAGKRTLPIADFYKSAGKVNLEHGELVTAIYISKDNYEGFGGHYIKYAQRNAMDIATLGCAVNVKLSSDKTTIEDMRLAFGVAGPVPMRCHETEKLVKGQKITPELFEQVGKTAITEVNPRTSWRASKEFRLQLVEELSKRALKQAIVFAGGAIYE
ncbi:xanthine dehydrogenase FAD-binding subunit [Hydrogenoanaerobacterium saccharovorans]|uniref:Xanthine dehydrogenase FAD-binding subunit n=1 Tax=Hydrogenoanaerobacterium saccharovorans TaxID=474960 RepID=A0A1H7YZ93_9FIRM|nr:xanthine dehydrogenase subunit XdhB [Hydrogenoanaerobacterium saccharovorans]RPF48922.1 xanthine dehydrogenase FAD-binding subunit [Hydrogenoanaerobacterium saccharovorans]SEM51315.1 xanthine dehydrogenase FAD-binding subunit [Hydrogenoanaerobacterium saccharovorans]